MAGSDTSSQPRLRDFQFIWRPLYRRRPPTIHFRRFDHLKGHLYEWSLAIGPIEIRRWRSDDPGYL